MFYPLAADDAGLSRRHTKEIKLALDPLARLSMHESHRCHLCRTRRLSSSYGASVLYRRVDSRSCVLYVVVSTAATVAHREEEEEESTVRSAGPYRPP